MSTKLLVVVALGATACVDAFVPAAPAPGVVRAPALRMAGKINDKISLGEAKVVNNVSTAASEILKDHKSGRPLFAAPPIPLSRASYWEIWNAYRHAAV